jgi:hypothetical protein
MGTGYREEHQARVCGTKEKIADIFTKPLARENFEYLRQKLGVVSPHSDSHNFNTVRQGERCKRHEESK